MARAAQVSWFNEQEEEEITRVEIAGQPIVSAHNRDHSTLEPRAPSLALFDSFKQALYTKLKPLPPDPPLDIPRLSDKLPHQKVYIPRRICRLQSLKSGRLSFLAFLVILAVIGTVVGTRLHRRSASERPNLPAVSSSSTPPINSTLVVSGRGPSSTNLSGHTTLSTASIRSTSSTQSTSSIQSTSSDVPATRMRLSNSTALASIAWADEKFVNQHRLYWQSDDNYIWESAYDAAQQTWTGSPVPIGYAKPMSPIAGVVTGPISFTFVSTTPSADTCKVS